MHYFRLQTNKIMNLKGNFKLDPTCKDAINGTLKIMSQISMFIIFKTDYFLYWFLCKSDLRNLQELLKEV